MSVHVLLNLLNELGKKLKCKACGAFYLFYATINFKITLKYHFCLKSVITLSLGTQRCHGRHSISRKSINTSGLSSLLYGVISLPDATSYDNYSNNMLFWTFIGIMLTFEKLDTKVGSILIQKHSNLYYIFSKLSM